MLDTRHEHLYETLINTMDTMAFIASEPAEPGAVECPPLPVKIEMSFKGSQRGTITLVASAQFGRYMAANVIGTTPDDPETAERAPDCLKELVNVVVGALMPRLAASADDQFELTIPELDDFAPENWKAFVTDERSVLLLADGNPMAVNMVFQE